MHASLDARGLTARWERFWFEPIPPHVYALLRIVFGALGCIGLLCLLDFRTFWDLDGLVPLTTWEAVKTSARSYDLGAVVGRAIWLGSFASFLGMAVGYRSGVSVALSFASALIQSSWNSLPLSGAHAVLVGMLFCLLWADCGAVWSVDARWAKHAVPAPYPIAPLRLMRIQVAVIYLNTGLWKIFSEYWRDGSALHYVLNENLFQRFSVDALPPQLDWLMTVGTYLTLTWEIAFPALLLFRRTRLLALGLGVLLHLGMLFSIDVGLFSFVILATYISFLDPWRLPHLLRPRGLEGVDSLDSGAHAGNKVAAVDD
jgi:hypothetical protein